MPTVMPVQSRVRQAAVTYDPPPLTLPLLTEFLRFLMSLVMAPNGPASP